MPDLQSAQNEKDRIIELERIIDALRQERDARHFAGWQEYEAAYDRIFRENAILRGLLRPFATRPDVVKYGALSRGLAREYAQHIKNAEAALGPTRRDA